MIEIGKFKKAYPLMALQPLEESYASILAGEMEFSLKYEDYPEVERTLSITIKIPTNYPNTPLAVYETAAAIPRSQDFHVNSDNTLCLGSYLQLKLWAVEGGGLLEFTDTFIKPFVYATMLKLDHGIEWIFGDLSHGSKGELEDCKSLFQVASKAAVVRCLEAAARKRSIGNKLQCLCGCGGRIGQCKRHLAVNRVRKATGATFIRNLISRIETVKE